MANEGAGVSRRDYLIKGGAVITVDADRGTLPRADVLVRDGVIVGIGADLDAADAEIIDAADMIVMPGLIDTHYHMWSAIGRNFLTDDGFSYFPAKWATAGHYAPDGRMDMLAAQSTCAAISSAHPGVSGACPNCRYSSCITT